MSEQGISGVQVRTEDDHDLNRFNGPDSYGHVVDHGPTSERMEWLGYSRSHARARSRRQNYRRQSIGQDQLPGVGQRSHTRGWRARIRT